MEYLFIFDCILNPIKNELLCRKIGKRLRLSPSQRKNKNLFSIVAEDHDLPRRFKGFIKGKIINEEGNKIQQIEIIVQPIKEFEDKSLILITRLLSYMIDDVVWVCVPNSILKKLDKCYNRM